MWHKFDNVLSFPYSSNNGDQPTFLVLSVLTNPYADMTRWSPRFYSPLQFKNVTTTSVGLDYFTILFHVYAIQVWTIQPIDMKSEQHR